MSAVPLPAVITSRFDRLKRTEKDEYLRCIQMLERAGSITPFGCIYVIERAGDQIYRKAGRTSLDNLGRRTTNLQTGDPGLQRVVSLCMFYNRDVAAAVESALKKEYQLGGLHAQGGTEWYIVPREQIVADIRRISHRLTIDQIRVNASGHAVEYLETALSTNFYGLLTFTIRDGELFEFSVTDAGREISDNMPVEEIVPPLDTAPLPGADNMASSKLSTWSRIIEIAIGLRHRLA
jgi:hypothetical protein